MSNLDKTCERDCTQRDSTGAVELIVEPKDTDLGGFSVRRVLPTRQRRKVGPWVFFDHMGPATFAPGPGINVRPHPHIGIATVTYLFEGEILHRDSLGSLQPIRPGDINLMVAGRGIVHSERERAEAITQPRVLNGLQLWLALPESQEEIAPAFYHYPSKDIPQVQVGDVKVRVMMGSAYGVTSPVFLHSRTLYLEADIDTHQQLDLQDEDERAIYVVQGELMVGHTIITEHCMAFFKAGEGVTIQATRNTRIALIGGETFNPRFMEWNFVSSRKERIAQAKDDWQQGHFDKVPGDEAEFIAYPS